MPDLPPTPEEPREHPRHQIPRTPVFIGPDAEARAQQLGLPGGTASLVAALRDGASAARATTAWHPVTYRGDRMWGESVASLRQYLHPFWEPARISGVDVVLNRDTGDAIIVTAGSVATGMPKYEPQVRYPRGDVNDALISGEPLNLFGNESLPDWRIWFLLHYLDQNALRGELSRPNALNHGWVTTWAERIILPDQGFDDPEGTRATMEGPPDIDIDVRRRAG